MSHWNRETLEREHAKHIAYVKSRIADGRRNASDSLARGFFPGFVWALSMTQEWNVYLDEAIRDYAHFLSSMD